MAYRRCDIYHDHALVDVSDADTGMSYSVRVPWAHRAHWIGWGDRPRATWSDHTGTEQLGVVLREDDTGADVEMEDGRRARLPPGTYKSWRPEVAKPLTKATPAKAGERWITVHPNGPDNKGVPVLIRPMPDGSHKIIGGAGGKLNHLRLHGVREPHEYDRAGAAARAAERKKETAAQRKARLDAMTPDARKVALEQEQAQKRHLKVKQDELRESERGFIQKVRETAGGVDEDLDPASLEKLTPEVADKRRNAHHRKQLRQAMRRKDEVLQRFTEDAADVAQAKASRDALHEDDDADPELARMVDEDLQLAEDERAEARAARTEQAVPVASPMAASAAAAETARQVLDETDHDDLAKRIDDLQAKPDRSAAEEVERRALESKRDAVLLHRAANGQLNEAEQRRVLELVGESADSESMRRAAAAKLRRSELQHEQAAQFAKVASEKGDDAAHALLQAKDNRLKVAQEERTARQLGLAGNRPVRDVEDAEIRELAASSARLREARRQVRELTGDIERGSYDRSRRAFELEHGEPPEDVQQQAHDALLTELTRRLEGVAMPRRTAFQQALGAGHFNALADVSLGLTRQALLDRVTVDALGTKNASVLMRWAMEKHGGVTPDAALSALESHHVEQVEQRSAAALAEAQRYIPDLVATATHAEDIEAALAQLDAHEQQIDKAAGAVGAAIGSMEGTATLSQAFREALPEHLTMRTDGGEQSLTWVHALGLRPGEYEVDKAKKEIRIPQSSWHRMVRPESKEEVSQRETVDAIKAGEHDEDGWLPPGMVSRAASSFTSPAPESPRYWQPLRVGEDLRGSIRDHIASRLAEGEPASSIRADLMSPQVLSRIPDSKHAELLQHLDEVFPRFERGLAPKIPEVDDLARGAPGDHLAVLEQHVAAAANGHPDADVEATRKALSSLLETSSNAPTGDGGIVGPRARQALQALAEKRRGNAAVPDWAMRRSPDHWQDSHTDMVRDWMKRTHPDDTDVHAQAIDINDAKVQDAVYRSLAELPEAKFAYQPVAHLDADGRRYLRDRFYNLLGIGDDRDFTKRFAEDEARATWRAPGGAERKLSEEPAQYIEGGGLFGGPTRVLNPDWTAWSKAAAQLAENHPKHGHQWGVRALGERPESRPSALVTPEVEAEAWQAHQRSGGDSDAVMTHLLSSGMVQHRDRHAVSSHLAGAMWDRQRALVDRRKENAKTPWAAYVHRMGGQEAAMEALQHHVRGELTDKLVEHYGKTTGQPLRTTTTNMPSMRAWVRSTTSLDDQAAYQRQLAELDSGTRERSASGQFKDMGGAGSLLGTREQRAEEREGFRQDQGGLFGSRAPSSGATASLFGGGSGAMAAPQEDANSATIAPLRSVPERGQRRSPGARVEAQLESVIGRFAHQFDPKRRASLWGGFSMDGDRVEQQRVIKAFGASKRMAAFLGTGSGKSATSIGAFTTAHDKGEVKKAIFAVPAAVQAQFAGEMQQFTEPGRYRWQTGEGLDHQGRLEALRNPDVHMSVLTHQALRDTVAKAMEDHFQREPERMKRDFLQADDDTRAAWVRSALDAHGIDPGFLYVDEAHQVTARVEGEGESMLSAVMHALAHPRNTTHLLAGTATPHKNDTSEMLSMARLVRPDRYADRQRFMANWGTSPELNPDAVRREMSGFTYSHRILPDGVNRINGSNPAVVDGKVVSSDDPIALHPEQQRKLGEIEAAYQRATRAHDRGTVDVEAMKVLSPRQFEGRPEGEHERVARMLMPSAAMMRDHQARRVINQSPEGRNAKLDRMLDVVQHDVQHGEWTDVAGRTSRGKPTLIFADRAEEAHHVRRALEKRGIRAGVYHGAMTADERERTRKAFEPGRGKEHEATLDVLVLTPSGEAGLNLQRAKAIHHYDVPMTEKSHAQRTGRAFRQGQRGDVDVYDWHTDTDYERNARERLKTKRALAAVFETPLGSLDETGIASHYRRALTERHQGVDPEVEALAAK